jgi:hypothetical protein
MPKNKFDTTEPRLNYHGLFIEVKIKDTKFYKKNGGIINEHIEEQLETMKKLKNKGYYAEFGCGYDECKGLIDWYFKTNRKTENLNQLGELDSTYTKIG